MERRWQNSAKHANANHKFAKQSIWGKSVRGWEKPEMVPYGCTLHEEGLIRKENRIPSFKAALTVCSRPMVLLAKMMVKWGYSSWEEVIRLCWKTLTSTHYPYPYFDLYFYLSLSLPLSPFIIAFSEWSILFHYSRPFYFFFFILTSLSFFIHLATFYLLSVPICAVKLLFSNPQHLSTYYT